MARGKRASRSREASPAAPEADNPTAADESGTPDEHEQMLDPSTSERRYWRDPLTGVQREIWRPGDGDGDVEHDHHERRGPLAPLEKRWRLYQSSPEGPFKARITEPPSNIILDDRAVYEILQSNIPRAQLPKRWSYDFSGQANIRHRRTHKGRPAYKDEQAASENGKYHSFKPTAKAAPPYFFSGENNYEPVLYHDLPAAPAEIPEPDDQDDTPVRPKQHNQYTAPHLLVRNGAESASLTKGKYRPRVNTFLRRSPSPPWVKDRKRLFGGVGIVRSGVSGSANAAPSSTFDFSFASAPAPTGMLAAGESMWVEQDELKEAEDDEEEVLPSVFDKAPSAKGNGATFGNEDTTQPRSTPSTPLKRQAPSALTSSRKKVPRQMGYIERLAAGILRDEEEAEAASPPVATAARTAASNEDRIARLEEELNAADVALGEKDRELAELQLELEEVQTQLALQKSVDDD